MTVEQKELIKATVPVLRKNGVALTEYFYDRMLNGNPELKNIFNKGNQQNGSQATALAMAVLAYAEHIDNPGVLAHAVNRISNKHVSLNIRPEHYAVVGRHLLGSISEVLADAATPELIDAWAKAYQQLADIMVGAEAGLYSNAVGKQGGWSGWRPFVVKQKIKESEEITSFYLYPTDRGKVADFLPGQYISVKVFLPELQIYQPRQYSLSSSPNGEYYRISVKKETAGTHKPEGLVSNHLHRNVNEEDIIELAPPAGDFTFDTKKETPVVFISGGVGVTPFIAMLEALINSTNKKRDITWIQGSRSYHVHAFRDHVASLVEKHGKVKVYTFYDKAEDEFLKNANLYEGYVDLNRIKDPIIPNADYYICGPSKFISLHYQHLLNKGVDKAKIHFEEFGPSVLAVA